MSVEAGPGELIVLGGVRLVSGERFRFVDHEELGGHLGLIDVVVNDRWVGEIEVVPSKMPPGAFERLRADLERVWTGLIFDPAGTAKVELASDDLEDIWRRLEPVVMDILREPRGELHREPRVGHVERSRGPIRGASAVRGAITRAPAQVFGTVRTTAIPDNRFVGDTLRLLVRALRREPDAHGIDPLVPARLAARPELVGPEVTGIPWGARSDPRYRQVLAANQRLRAGTFRPTEGPGEARRGIRALPRLYEYWVFLKVLEQARALYGVPVNGFDELHRTMADGVPLLSLRSGTTVEFPGPVYVAFEPAITSDARGWMGLEYVPHPDPARQQFVATPDVVVFRPGSLPWMTVIDAKYVARHRIELAAADLHDKYSRIRAEGEPVVRMVLAAHPHRDLTHRWSGYGVHAFDPGSGVSQLPLPTPPRVTVAGRGGKERQVVVDQRWMARVLGNERMHFASLVAELSRERPTAITYVMPDLPVLAPLARAAERHGLRVELAPDDAVGYHAAVIRAVGDVAGSGEVVLVSGDPEVTAHDDVARSGVTVTADLRGLVRDGHVQSMSAERPPSALRATGAERFDQGVFEREVLEVLGRAVPGAGARIGLADLGNLLSAHSPTYMAKGGRKLFELLEPLLGTGSWRLVDGGTERASLVRES